MPTTTPTTINLNPIDEPLQVREALVVGTPTPGKLMELTSTGTLQAHSTETGNNQRFFLLEQRSKAADITTVYVAGDTCRYMRARPGDEVYAFLINGAGQDVTANTEQLVSDGAGNLKVAAGTETDNELVAETLETIDNDPGSAAVRIKVRVI